MKVTTHTGHQATVGRHGDVRWRGHLHQFNSPHQAYRRLSMYAIDGVPGDVAHVRQDRPRGPWIARLPKGDTEHRTKSDAQIAVERALGLREDTP